MWAPHPMGRSCAPHSSHLHGQDEAVAIQGVLPIQKAIQGQCSADVVQGKDAVGVPWKRVTFQVCLGPRAGGHWL